MTMTEHPNAEQGTQDLDNSPAFYLWWTKLPHPVLGWTAQSYSYEAWKERGRRDNAELAALRDRLARAEAENERLGVLDAVLKERRHHPQCPTVSPARGDCTCWLAAVLSEGHQQADREREAMHADHEQLKTAFGQLQADLESCRRGYFRVERERDELRRGGEAK